MAITGGPATEGSTFSIPFVFTDHNAALITSPSTITFWWTKSDGTPINGMDAYDALTDASNVFTWDSGTATLTWTPRINDVVASSGTGNIITLYVKWNADANAKAFQDMLQVTDIGELSI